MSLLLHQGWSLLLEKRTAHNHSFGHRETSSSLKGKAWLKSVLVNNAPTQSGTAMSKDVGRSSRRLKGHRLTRAARGRAEGVVSPMNQRGLEPFLTYSASSITTEITDTLDWMFVSIIFHGKESFIPMKKCFQNNKFLSNFCFLKNSFLLLQ